MDYKIDDIESLYCDQIPFEFEQCWEPKPEEATDEAVQVLEGWSPYQFYKPNHDIYFHYSLEGDVITEAFRLDLHVYYQGQEVKECLVTPVDEPLGKILAFLIPTIIAQRYNAVAGYYTKCTNVVDMTCCTLCQKDKSGRYLIPYRRLYEHFINNHSGQTTKSANKS